MKGFFAKDNVVLVVRFDRTLYVKKWFGSKVHIKRVHFALANHLKLPFLTMDVKQSSVWLTTTVITNICPSDSIYQQQKCLLQTHNLIIAQNYSSIEIRTCHYITLRLKKCSRLDLRRVDEACLEENFPNLKTSCDGGQSVKVIEEW